MTMKAVDMLDMVRGMRKSYFDLFMYSQPKDDEDLARMAELPLQLGVALMMDMPIILLVKEGETAPAKVLAACEKVLYVNYDDMDTTKVLIAKAIKEFYEERGVDPGTIGKARSSDNAGGSTPG